MNEHDLRHLEIPLPFSPQRHSMSDRAQERVQIWAQRFGLLQDEAAARRFESLGYARFSAYWCPTSSFADMLLVAEWITVFFVFDDLQDLAIITGRLDDYDHLRHTALEVVHERGVAGPVPPVIAALSNLCTRTFPRNSEAWARRFALNLELWLVGHARENAFRRAGKSPSPDEYPRLRRDACTVLPTADLTEVIEHTEIPDALYYGPAYQEMIATTADIMCLINDLHSLAIETDAEDTINLVTTLQHHLGMELPQAVTEVRRLIEVRIADHRAAAEAMTAEMDALQLPPRIRHGVRRCIRDCQSAIAGMELWDRTDTVRFTPDADLRDARNIDYGNGFLDRV
ncbi:terpene synthase family protein [Nocardia sp. CA-151230]|uniref:terpene synthase family protein n=1 Tax=Nocardia sp. CA-151230 TaxID=3239982 RepID=UPI003D8C5487